jgi:hypothetical protein
MFLSPWTNRPRSISSTRGRVSAVFVISDDDLRENREHTADGGKHLAGFTVRIRDGQGDLLAQAKKVLYIRRKTE